MNSIKIHSLAFVILLPTILIFSEGNLVVNLIGAAYILALFRLSKTTVGKRFIRKFYRASLRLNNWLESCAE